MRLCLINPDYELRPLEGVPLGLAQLYGLLRKTSHEILLVDLAVDPQSISKALDFDADLYGITGIMGAFSSQKKLAHRIREAHPRAMIVGGGALISGAYRTILAHSNIDVAVLGEGEISLGKLISSLESGGDPSNIQGIAYKRDGAIVVTPTPEDFVDLDDLPLPDYSAFDMEKYIAVMRQYMSEDTHMRTMGIITSRSCPFSCNFCSRVFGTTLRTRSPRLIVEEMIHLRDHYDIEHILFLDDTFTLSTRRVKEFAQALEEKNLTMNYSCNSRVNYVNDEMCRILKATGCQHLYFGMESGSDKVLRLMKKQATVAMARKAIRTVRKHRIGCWGNFMIGYPGETPDDFRQTIQFIKEEDVFAPGFAFTTPLPSSPLYEMALSKGWITDEVEYLKSLNSLQTFGLNMTSLSDFELKKMCADAVDELTDFFAAKYPAEIRSAERLDEKSSRLELRCPRCKNVFARTVSDPRLFNLAMFCPTCYTPSYLKPQDVPHLNGQIHKAMEFLATARSQDKRIAIWPAGEQARALCRIVDFGPTLLGFGDNNPSKQGTIHCDRPVYALQDLLSLKPDLVMVVAPYAGETILSSLRPYASQFQLELF